MLFVNTLILCSSAKYTSTHNVVISEMITFIFYLQLVIKMFKSERLTGEVTKQKMCVLHLCISLRISRHLMLKCKIHMKQLFVNISRYSGVNILSLVNAADILFIFLYLLYVIKKCLCLIISVYILLNIH